MHHPTLANLAAALASLDAAAETHESGTKGWSMIVDAEAVVEELIRHEVNSTWPDDEPTHLDSKET